MRLAFLWLIGHVIGHVYCFRSSQCPSSNPVCEWTVSSPWEIVHRTFLPSTARIRTVELVGDGSFFLAQGKFGANDTGDLVGSLLPAFAGSRLLTYKYSKTIGNAKLEVMLKSEDRWSMIDSVTTNVADLWVNRTSLVPPVSSPHRIVFRVSSIYDSFDSIAVDDIQLYPVSSGVISTQKAKGIDYADFAGNMRDREIRRSQSTAASNSARSCSGLKCNFEENSCSWSHPGFRPLKGKIVSEAVGAASLDSEPVFIPPNSHLEISIFTRYTNDANYTFSDSSLISIYQRIGSDNVLLWSQGGIALPGWNSIRIPLRVASLPSSLHVKTMTSDGSFVAISKTNLVDERGEELSCGVNVHAIRPQAVGDIQRLTAVQTLSRDDPQPTTTETATTHPQRYRPRLTVNKFAASPIAPAEVSSVAERVQSPSIIRAHSVNSLRSASSINDRVATSTVTSRSATPFPKRLSSDILNGQNALQIQQLAQKFGISGLTTLDAERLLGRAKQLMNTKKTSLNKLSPILPINNSRSGPVSPEKPTSSLLSLLPATLNGAIASKIANMLDLPSTNGADSRPFSRRNMDYVVQNAFNAYINQARP